MRYQFGDSSVAPVDGNYLELLSDFLSYAAEVLQAADSIASERSQDAELGRQVERELANLARIGKRVATSLTGEHEPGSPSRRLLETLRELTSAEVEGELERTRQDRQEAQARAAQEIDRLGRVGLHALAAFLSRQDIPASSASLRLRLTEERAYTGRLRLQADMGLDAVFELAIPDDHVYASVRRVDELAGRVSVRVPRERGLVFKRVKAKAVRVHKYYVTELLHSADGTVVRIRREPALDAEGFDLSLGEPGHVRIVEVGAGGVEVGTPHSLFGTDAAELIDLCEAAACDAELLAYRRTRMLQATLDGTPVQSLDDVSLPVARILPLVAPTIREIAARSDSETHLVLYEIGGGGERIRHEANRSELRQRIRRLPAAAQAAFEMLGLEPPVRPSAKPRSMTDIDASWDEHSRVPAMPRASSASLTG